ncbi:MAG: FKBP-type peptidyl-prolyl cis-trans isomerase [Thermoanaerobaculia bacterium]|nr:FKBP-type peptidyl-prolyl cis-trans isomerase [Thermoanaerobaculia bacterium]
MPNRDTEVSIMYTLKLTDGTEVAGNLEAGPYLYTPGQDELIPELEEVLRGSSIGEKRQLRLDHGPGDRLSSGIARLAMLLGHPGESLVFDVQVVEIAPRRELEAKAVEPVPGLGVSTRSDSR